VKNRGAPRRATRLRSRALAAAAAALSPAPATAAAAAAVALHVRREEAFDERLLDFSQKQTL